MKKILQNKSFEVTFNQDFKAVITACSKINRKGQTGTWITNSMLDAYLKLYQLGYAKSVEVWQDSMLVGGLYGVETGNHVFCGESMFSKVTNASKVGFISFIQQTDYRLIDCQVHTKHLESLGAEKISRTYFLEHLK